MSTDKPITIPVRLDEKTFKRFARFDMFALRRKWIRPVLFSLILIVFVGSILASISKVSIERDSVVIPNNALLTSSPARLKSLISPVV